MAIIFSKYSVCLSTSSAFLDKVSEIMSEKILELISNNKYISSKKIAEILNFAPRSVERKIAVLKTTGYLRRVGSPKAGHWEIINKGKGSIKK